MQNLDISIFSPEKEKEDVNMMKLLSDESEYTDDNESEYTEITLNSDDGLLSKVLNIYGDYSDIFKKLDNIHFHENRYCSLYLGEYIEQYIIRFLGGEIVPGLEYKVRGKIRRPADFVLDYQGTKIKVKHSAGCLTYGRDHGNLAFFWRFPVNFNYDTDAFLLSAWDTRKSLILQYMWMIMRDEKFGNLPFWRRYDIKIFDTKDYISKMEKYEMKINFIELENIIANIRKADMISVLIDKQRDIFLKTDMKINIKRLARTALLHELE